MGLSARRLVTTSARLVVGAWTLVGAVLLLLLVAETGYRAVSELQARRAAARRASSRGVREPQAALPWYADYVREYDAARALEWRPYVYWRHRPGLRGRYVSTDSVGHRTTPQPAPAGPLAASAPLTVYFMGSSTMWGTAQRDDRTIAAVTAQRLRTLVGPGARLEVANLGENAYVFTQSLLALTIALRSGERPDIVVFRDGINEAEAVVQTGRAGLPLFEPKRAAEFAMGRALDRSSYDRGLGKDLRALAILGDQALRQSDVLGRVRGVGEAEPTEYIAADSATRDIVRAYVANVRIIEALGRAYGFVPIYTWELSVHTTQKRLTPFETRVLRTIERDPYQRRVREVLREAPAQLGPLMARLAPGRFVDESALFRGDTLAVFADYVGHNTEIAVPRIVDGFWPVLEAAVRAQSATAGEAGR